MSAAQLQARAPLFTFVPSEPPACVGVKVVGSDVTRRVLPWVPVRQWVLTVPYRLRYRLA
jgi:hypothetical protein